MNSLEANIRDNKSKGQLNAIRNSGNIPAIIYGGKDKNQKISISKKYINQICLEDLNYNLFAHNPDSVKRITSVSHHVGPTAERSAIKDVVSDRFNEFSSKRLKLQAESIYHKILVRKQLISI